MLGRNATLRQIYSIVRGTHSKRTVQSSRCWMLCRHRKVGVIWRNTQRATQRSLTLHMEADSHTIAARYLIAYEKSLSAKKATFKIHINDPNFRTVMDKGPGDTIDTVTVSAFGTQGELNRTLESPLCIREPLAPTRIYQPFFLDSLFKAEKASIRRDPSVAIGDWERKCRPL